MYAQVHYTCPKCQEFKIMRLGNKGLPEESLRFQIEIQGIRCPSCGTQVQSIPKEDYKIIAD